jgi:hypothetical protein
MANSGALLGRDLLGACRGAARCTVPAARMGATAAARPRCPRRRMPDCASPMMTVVCASSSSGRPQDTHTTHRRALLAAALLPLLKRAAAGLCSLCVTQQPACEILHTGCTV